MYTHILGESHRLKHLRAEHPAVADFDPAVEQRVEGKDLERWLGGGADMTLAMNARAWRAMAYLCIGVICGLKPDIFDAHLLEENPHETWKFDQFKDIYECRLSERAHQLNLRALSRGQQRRLQPGEIPQDAWHPWSRS
jgi:hypothetical protein